MTAEHTPWRFWDFRPVLPKCLTFVGLGFSNAFIFCYAQNAPHKRNWVDASSLDICIEPKHRAKRYDHTNWIPALRATSRHS